MVQSVKTCNVNVGVGDEQLRVEVPQGVQQTMAATGLLLEKAGDDFNTLAIVPALTEEQFEKFRAETAKQVAEMSRGQLALFFASMAMWNAQQVQLAIRGTCNTIMQQVDPENCRQI